MTPASFTKVMPKLRLLKVLTLLPVVPVASVVADEPEGLTYSGATTWNATTGTLVFSSSGTMPDTKEEFYWQVPAKVSRIEIAANVTVRGGFRVTFRQAANPLHISGRHRETSVLYGSDVEKWTTRNGIAENDKWRYGAINVVEDAVVYVHNLTSRNPRSYNISGYANQAVLHVSQCNLIDDRAGDNNNSDGFIGAAGSSISDSFISTADDGIKIYHDIAIRNVTIEQHRNGAPIQFGWGGEAGVAKATIENLVIRGVNEQQLYNMAPFTWEGGTAGAREVEIVGLSVSIEGRLFDESAGDWVPIGLFELKPKGCKLNLTAVASDTGGLPLGIRRTQGVIRLNGIDR